LARRINVIAVSTDDRESRDSATRDDVLALVGKIAADSENYLESVHRLVNPFSFYGEYFGMMDAGRLARETKTLAGVIDLLPEKERMIAYEALLEIIVGVWERGRASPPTIGHSAEAKIAATERGRAGKKAEDDIRVKKRRAIVGQVLGELGRRPRRGEFKRIYDAVVEKWREQRRTDDRQMDPPDDPSERSVRDDINAILQN
jgi:hypothetical protein